MPANEADVRVEQIKFWGLVVTIIITGVVGPSLSFYYANRNAQSNHAQSAQGYEVLATMANQHEQRLDNIEKTLLRLETQLKVAPATQVSLTGPIIVPGARVDPWPHVVAKAPMKAPPAAKAPVKTGMTVLVNPKYAPASASMPIRRAPMKAPRQLKDVH